ncbi:Uncharacterised protein [Vibrio cholerae]|nr:Uncharacterised protein [Vibrio cholerae]
MWQSRNPTQFPVNGWSTFLGSSFSPRCSLEITLPTSMMSEIGILVIFLKSFLNCVEYSSLYMLNFAFSKLIQHSFNGFSFMSFSFNELLNCRCSNLIRLWNSQLKRDSTMINNRFCK